MKTIRVSGVGSCLIDRLYNDVPFNSDTFSPYLSKNRGDGGLYPGHLVFKEEFEKFCNKNLQSALKEITHQKQADKLNIGGPCIVPLIHASQLTHDTNCDFSFYGCRGNDDDGDYIISSIEGPRLDVTNYVVKEDLTPSTTVLSDPDYDNGNGERIFINQLGVAADYSPHEINDAFFRSDITVFGGTALVPNIHDNLTGLLKRAKGNNSITILNTVYDYRNEKLNPRQRWPLGENDESYKFIDLLIADREESLRLSGKKTIRGAMSFFKSKGTGAVIITSGAENIHFYSKGRIFYPVQHSTLPVSKAVAEDLRKGLSGDTTGCGDNFVGGVIASLVEQLGEKYQIQNNFDETDNKETGNKLDLTRANILGVVSGGFACLYVGGTYIENYEGEKKSLLNPYYKKYIEQIGA